jgi:hypothetical protein
MIKIQPLPHVLTTFTRKFSNIMTPSEVNFELLWGLIYLNLKVRSQAMVLGVYHYANTSRSCHMDHKTKSNGQLNCYTPYGVWWNFLLVVSMFVKSRTMLKLGSRP